MSRSNLPRCPWSKSEQRRHAREFGQSYAKELYEDFQRDPESFGPNFFPRYPSIAARLAGSSVAFSFPGSVNKLLYGYAARCAARAARSILSKAFLARAS